MALARYKDLCMDAGDAHRLGAFWAAALGRELVDRGDGSVRLEGAGPEQVVWLDPVPEPKAVKHRVHLDVHTRDVADLVAAGARVLREPGDERTWWVMADPEGGEFCAFRRDEVPAQRLYALAVDAADPRAQAGWWGDVLGGRVRDEQQRWWWVDLPGEPFQSMVFMPVPEPKTVKNRIHWDLTSSDVTALVERGARVLREPGGDIDWHVLADPEGNEFCVFAPADAGAPT